MWYSKNKDYLFNIYTWKTKYSRVFLIFYVCVLYYYTALLLGRPYYAVMLSVRPSVRPSQLRPISSVRKVVETSSSNFMENIFSRVQLTTTFSGRKWKVLKELTIYRAVEISTRCRLSGDSCRQRDLQRMSCWRWVLTAQPRDFP